VATSGSSSVDINKNWDLQFSWSRSSYSNTENYSVISWTLKLVNDGYGSINCNDRDWSVTVNGQKYSGTNNPSASTGASPTLATGSTTIYHDSWGSAKSFSYSYSQEMAVTLSGTYYGTISGSGSGSIDGIARKTYTVTYNANGGSLGSVPSTQTKTHGVTLTLSSASPTRSGYTFEGWGTSASDTSVDYAAGGSYTSNAGDELFAIWKKIIELSYDANKGSGAPSKQSATIYNATTSHKFTISSTEPTRTGYTFLGWSTSSSATSSSYSSGGSITLSSSDVLYAVWKANTYTIDYDSNGGTGTTSSQTHTYDTAKNLTSNAFVRTGYTFTGWNTEPNGSGNSYNDGEPVMNLSSDDGAIVTLYAQWREHVLTVHYKSNYATYAYVDGESKDVSSDKKDVIVRTSEYKYATSIPEGLNNYSRVNDDTYMKRTRYEATGYWGTGSDPEIESIVVVPEDGSFDSGAELAERLGILESFNIGDVEIDLYAQWVLLCSYVTIYSEDGVPQRGMIHFYMDNNVNFVTSDGEMFKDNNDDYFMTNDGSVLHYGIVTIYNSDGVPYMAV